MKNNNHTLNQFKMKTNLLSIVVFLVGALTATTALAQSPNLGTASSYALFTAVGAFTNTGPSVITGDIGTNAGAFTGFPPGTVNGQVHVADPASTTAATDVATAYGYLSALTCGIVLGTGLGNGQTLTPNVYCTGAASTLNGDLILDAQGDPGALFIFKIDGALSTGSSSNVLLINGASLCNVYWQINGQFDLGTSAVFRGIIVANGAINLYTSSTLLGKGLTQAGAINLQSNVVTISTEPVVASITGTTTVCVGKTTSLSNTTIGGVWTSSDTLLATINNIGLVTGVLQGVPTIHYTVTNSIGCITRVSTPVIVNKNTSLATITGASGICIGSTTSLLGTPAGGTWTSNNNTVATITNLGLVSGLSAGATQFVFTNTATTCSATSLAVTINAGTASSTTIANCGSYLWNGVSYPATGTYTKTFTGGSSAGCDSIATLHLTINAATSSSTTIANCGSYFWNGVSYPATGTYTKTFTGGSSAGCDSIATLHLTVNAATSSSTTIANCGSYLWNGISYPATGTYTKTFTGGSSAGCDSIATLHLTINSATSSSTNIASCGNYLWNGVSYATAGTYIKTFTGGNKVGCDSIATLHLTINHATYSTTTVVTCGCLSYTWNGINYSANGIYIDTLIGANSVGCDSIATINLTLNLLPKTPVILNSTIAISGARNGVIYSVTPVAGAVSYQWAYSGTGATIYNNGTAAITVDFAANATGGDILVQSVSATGCLSIAQVVSVTITPLPVVLSSFNGLKFNKDVLLKWTSVSEINVTEFNIQRSYNGIDFDKVGAMIAKGSGNYSFIDNSIIKTGIIYYQLEVVGNDGSKEYSKVLAINMDTKSTDISIYPNPAKGTVMILSPYSTGRLAICNLMGETMLSQQIIDKQNKVNVGSLLPGVYIVNVLTAEGKITSKLIVQ